MLSMHCVISRTGSIQYLIGRGEMQFEEIGVGKVLNGLVRIKQEAEPLVG